MADPGGARGPLLGAAAALAFLSGALHVYFAFAYFSQELPLQVMFLGMAGVYFVGTALALFGWKHDLVLRGAAVFVVLLLATWAGGAANGRLVNLEPLSLVDKAVEAALLVVLLLLIRNRKEAAGGPSTPSQ